MDQLVKKLVLLFIGLVASVLTFAQTDSSKVAMNELVASEREFPMADTLRANGMIYVVVGVLVIVLIGLFAYLISVDKKVSKLEKNRD
jgi:uncharacterized membrane protein